jgi:hypothetical protein
MLRAAVAGPLVGRAGEFKLIDSLLDDVRNGHGRCVLLSGEGGVGKTRLVREFCAAHADEAAVIWASCLPLLSATKPIASLQDALRRRRVDDPTEPAAPMPAGTEDFAHAFDEWLSRVGRSRWWWMTCSGRIRARWTCSPACWPAWTHSGCCLSARTATPASAHPTRYGDGWPTPAGCQE